MKLKDEPGGDGPRAGSEHHDRSIERIAGDAASEVQEENPSLPPGCELFQHMPHKSP